MFDEAEPKITGRQQSITEIFSDAYRLILPYFQRGYAWKEEHALRLLSDILAVVDGDKQFDWYPLGAIIVAQRAESPEASVADGHQRLITLTILVALLRDRESDSALKAALSACLQASAPDQPPFYRLVTHEAARACLEMCVQTPGSTSSPYPGDEDDISESEENILTNRDAMAAEIDALSEDRRQALARFLLTRCLVIVIRVREPHIAQFLFSTMHDTGLKPSHIDMFKAQVLGRVRSVARERCQTVWEGLEARLGQSGFEALLRHIAELHTRNALADATISVLEKHFDLQEASAAESFVERTLRRFGGMFADLIEAPSRGVVFPPGMSRRLQYLSWIRNHDTWVVPMLHWMHTKGIDHPDSETFLQQLEALAWMQMICTVEPPQRHKRYMRLLTEIDENTALDRVGALTIRRAERQKIATTLSMPNYTNRSYKLFLLLRANAAIEGDDAVRSVPEATIEHIYPRNPANNSLWVNDFRTPDVASRYRNSLGNLTLLTRSEQERSKNSDFSIKRTVLAGSLFALSRRLANQRSWRPEDIESTTADVIGILMRSWKLEHP